MEKDYQIVSHSLDENLKYTLLETQQNYLSWPIVYFLYNTTFKEAYVGETTDMLTRFTVHRNTKKKQHLSSLSLILSKFFNKSATLYLEANLIRYIAADKQYSLQNGNLGLVDHQFFDQKKYWSIFRNIWDDLRKMGIVRHSLEHIDNSDLFKYSPYKSLSKEQVEGLKMVLHCILDDNSEATLLHGGAGTGKSILAIFLFKLLKTNLDDFNFTDFDEDDRELFELLEKVKLRFGDLNMALVIPMSSFRKTIQNVFKNIKGLSPKMVIGPSEVVKQHYDLLIVDESHRLRQRVNLGSYFGTFDKNAELLELDKHTSSELDWIRLKSKKHILFYDVSQSIKPSDVSKNEFIELEQLPTTRSERLKTQFRVKGGNEYVSFVRKIFNSKIAVIDKHFQSKEYEVFLYHSLDKMVSAIKQKEEQNQLSRLVAGFAWEWVSNKSANVYDIIIGNTKLKWNSVTVDWVNSLNSVNEVGCIHTIQGYDLNYTGVIIGPEIDYDFSINEFIIHKDRYKDKNGKNSIEDVNVLKDYIINIYTTMLLRGISGTFIYCCNDNLRRYFEQFVPVKDLDEVKKDVIISDTQVADSIPYYDLEIAAGSFSELQQYEAPRFIILDQSNYDPTRYFACKVVGESMNKIIPNGAICLFEKYAGGSRNGRICLVESAHFVDVDFGSNYTIKEYSSKKTISEEGWQHEEITLLPISTISSYERIVLRDEELLDLKVIGLFVKVLEK
jgi:hypothetical protein